MTSLIHSLVLVIAILFASFSAVAQSAPSELVKLIKNGGAYVETKAGKPLISHRADEQFIPASITKVVTSLCALETLGRDFRFKTDFFLDESSETLWVKGSGDPSLTSEVLSILATKLKPKLPSISRIVIDESLFAEDLGIDGSSATLNPYDAKNGAFVVNFNTAELTHSKQGKALSGEPQTPLTKSSTMAALKLARGTSDRVNLTVLGIEAAIYGGELLAAFLREAGARGEMRVSTGELSSAAEKLYTHSSLQTLEGIVRGLLEYSTNFTTNQIFLTLGVLQGTPPATVSQGKAAIDKCLSEILNISDAEFFEGAGLSRKNKISPREMIKVLRKFEPYKDLLKVRDGFIAKTGSLTGVNTLAGYFETKKYGEVRFALMVNDSVPQDYRYTVATAIRKILDIS